MVSKATELFETRVAWRRKFQPGWNWSQRDSGGGEELGEEGVVQSDGVGVVNYKHRMELSRETKNENEENSGTVH